MGAKDTVMKSKEIAKILTQIVGAETGDKFTARDVRSEDYAIAEAQAEISFKAGIREVAQIINARKNTPQGTTVDPVYSVYFYTSEIENLLKGQARLKEWGIDV